jgi:hypothetical protein
MAEIDFDEWLANYKPPELKFYAIFDTTSGAVTGIYPEHALAAETKNSVEIDHETAQLINEGKLKLNSCFVDMSSGSFEIAEIKNLVKIDDVLHRVVAKEWTDISDPDVTITHDVKSSTLSFELSKKYKTRKIHWDGSTTMTFLITDYNDPNLLRNVIKFSIDELASAPQVKKVDQLEKFSVYTKRLFPLYVLETNESN